MLRREREIDDIGIADVLSIYHDDRRTRLGFPTSTSSSGTASRSNR